MAGITVRDENGNVILSAGDYYLRKIDTITVSAKDKRTFFKYDGMSHSSNIISTRASGIWNYIVISIANGGFWLYSQHAYDYYLEVGKYTDYIIDIYKRD
ncbi:MAG: hypothetical protein [Bacteriophage sp.]|nr:MAG: hypothetical protein [Bacteriophage sp.]